jgi:hypothetical protein
MREQTTVSILCAARAAVAIALVFVGFAAFEAFRVDAENRRKKEHEAMSIAAISTHIPRETDRGGSMASVAPIRDFLLRCKESSRDVAADTEYGRQCRLAEGVLRTVDF